MFSLSHIIRMTDSVGILEHCKLVTPDPSEGYTVDDNARALQFMLRLPARTPEVLRLIGIYARFLFESVTDTGFHNDRNEHGVWVDAPGLGDWYGRAMLAYADMAVLGPKTMQKKGAIMFRQSFHLLSSIDSVRTESLVLEACCRFWKAGVCSKDTLAPLIRHAADRLVGMYTAHTDSSWKWFEDALTYENARIPEALLLASQVMESKEYMAVGKSALDFLVLQTFDAAKETFAWIGNNGWYPRGGVKAVFGQQPVDAAAMVEALVTAYGVTGMQTYRHLAHRAFDWYSGNNIYGASLIDKKSGGILDGLEEYGVNLNEGAESVITYGLAKIALDEMDKLSPS